MNKNISRFIFILILLIGDIPEVSAQIHLILWTADYSPDGRYLAIGGNHGELKIYKGRKLKLHYSTPIEGMITKVRWHPRENILAINTQSGRHPVQIYNLEQNTLKHFALKTSSSARALDWSPDGKYLAVADTEGMITIFDLDGKVVNSFPKDNTKSYTGLSWHPSKDELLVVSEYIRHFDIQGNQLNKIRHRPEDVLLLSIKWHPSGEFFVSGDYGLYGDQRVYPLLNYWSPSGELIKSAEGSIGEYRNITWSPNHKVLATASDGVRLWNTKGELLKAIASEYLLWGITWHPKGKRIAATDEKGNVYIWNKKGKLKRSIKYQNHESN